MDIPDWFTMLGNLAISLRSVERLLTALAYVLGIGFFFLAVLKFKAVLSTHGASREPIFTGLAYLLVGAILLYVPTSIDVFSNTTFGVGNILQYAAWHPYNPVIAMQELIKVAGIIWFVRGSSLLAQASHPGTQHGPKGLVFLFAGILAMNYEATAATLNDAVEYLISLTSK